MASSSKKPNTFVARTVDFAVIGLTFCVAGHFLGIDVQSGFVVLAILYSCVMLIALRLGTLILSAVFITPDSVIRTILENAAGLTIGAIAMLFLQFSIAALTQLFALIVVSGVMAFFVLGTIAPLIKSKQPSSII
jgi:hypothetical protein